MKAYIVLLLAIGQTAFAAQKSECFDGNFSACKEIANAYGSTSDKRGAVDFFNTACSSQNLKITCQVITTEKSETMKKTLEMARMDGAMFVMTGLKTDKIYLVTQSQ